MVLFVARLSATITPTADVYGPQVPSSFTATLTTGLAFQQASDLLIVNAGQPGAVRSPATVLKLGTDYVVTGGGYNSANQMQVGSFTLTNTGPNSPITGDNLYVIRNVPANQLTVFANGGYLTAAMIEQALDKQATLAQMTVNNGLASLHVETYETANAVPPNLLMPLALRANSIVGFDANGNVAFFPTANSTPNTNSIGQFSQLGVGTAPSNNVPINFQPIATSSGGALKALRNSPTMIVTANGDTLYNSIQGGTIVGNSYTNLNYYGTTVAQPTLASGSVANAYQLYITQGINATNNYGIYQAGTDANLLNNLGINVTPTINIPVNFQPVATSVAGGLKGVRISPTLNATANGDTLYNTIQGGTINGGSYTGLNYYGVTIGQPTLASGSLSNSYALYFTTGPAATNKYGIYQAGTDKNVLNNLTLASGGGGAITFADGTVQTTAATGGGGGVTNITTGVGITANASTGSILLTNSGVTSLVQGSGITLNAGTGSITVSASGTAGVTTANGTANQVLVNGTSGSAQTGAIVLTTPQNIDTAANVQFGTLGIGTAVGAGNGVNLQPSVTASGGLSKGLRISPSITQAANGDVIYDEILGGTINSNSFTNGSIYELTLGSPTVTGTFTNGYQLYLSGLASGTFTNKYGIYQAGTEANVLNGSLSAPSLTLSTTPLAVSSGGTGVTTSSGANSVVLRDSNSNVFANNFFKNFLNQAASGTTITLTASSSPDMVITGSGGQVIKLPDATTLPNGNIFTFNNNQSSGTITVQNNSGTTIATLQSGSFIDVVLLSNATSTGTWDYHNVAPSNASWSTNTLSWAGSYTNGTWNGNTIGVGYGGTGATSLTGYVYGNGTSAMTASTTIPTSALSGTISLTSQVSGTLPVANGGTGVTTSTGTGSTVLSASPTFTGTVTTNGISNTNDLTTGTLEVGTTLTAGVGVTLQPTVSSSGGTAKGVRTTPTLTAAANSDYLYSNIFGGTVTNSSYTGVNYAELALGAPTVTGSFSNGYQLYLSGLSSGTFSNKYGIYQAGTEPNVFGGAVTVPNFTATGTTTLATSLTGYLSASSGVVSASSTIPTSALSGVVSATNGGTGVAGTITGYVYANGTSAHTASTTIPTSALSGTISNAQLANSSVTVTAGTGLGGGGAVSLGSSVTLTNAGVTSLTGTSNQVNVSASTGGVTLSTPQSIATSSSPQFSSLGIGAAASGTAGDLYANNTFEVGTSVSSGIGVNLQPSVTSSAASNKSVRVAGTQTAAANSDAIYNFIEGGTVATGTYTGLNYYEAIMGAPTFTGSGNITNAYQLYLSGFGSPGVTITNKYGFYQAGSEQNYFGGFINVAGSARGATNQNMTPSTTTVSSTNIDWSTSNSFYKTLSANTTFTFSNAVDGQVITICLLNTTSNYTVTWPSMKWAGGTAPTMTTGAHYDVYTIYYNATAGYYFGSYVQNF